MSASASLGLLALAWPPTQAQVALLVVSLIFLIGLVGTVVPMLPGILIIWLGIVVDKLWLGDAGVPWWFVFTSGILIVVVQLFEMLCGAWGAKKFGGTWRGVAGALVGGLAGIFLPPPLLWLLLGPIIGAVVGELLGGRRFAEAGKAGVGTIVGAVVAFVLKISIAVFVIGWFYYLAW